MLRKKLVAEDLACNPEFREWVLSPTKNTTAYWQEWATSSPENQDILNEAVILVHSFQAKEVSFSKSDEDNLWSRINNAILNKNELTESNEHDRFDPYDTTSKNHLVKWISIAASIVILSAVSWFYVGNLNRTKEVAQLPEPIKLIQRDVPKGQKLKMFLPDGSKVVLNSLSSISYPSEFQENLREVSVVGEVHFEVKKDSLRPFHVKSKGFVTEVLGTTFNVKAYPEAKNIMVSLLSGKVVVRSAKDDSKIAIDPGEEVKMDTESGKMTKKKVQYPDELRWFDGVLSFNNEPLNDVFEKLELWYGVDFDIEGMPHGKVVTGKFENEYLDNVLQSIQYTVSFNFKIDGNKVYVKF